MDVLEIVIGHLVLTGIIVALAVIVTGLVLLLIGRMKKWKV